MALQNAQPAGPVGLALRPPAAPVRDPFLQIGFLVLLAYLFVLYSRVFDITFSFLKIPALLYLLAVATTLLTGGFRRAISHRIGFWMLLFFVWEGVTLPFSVWKGGSFGVFADAAVRAFLTFAIIAGLIVTFDQCKKAVSWLVFSMLTLSIVTFIFGSTQSGRLFLPGGKFSNPNDLAQVILITLPFFWFTIMSAPPTLFGKFPRVIALVIVMAVIARSGSRGTEVGFLVMMAVVFWRSSFAGKVGVALAGVLMLLGAWLFLPHSVLTRYLTFAETISAEQGEVLAPDDLHLSAVSSAAARHVLFVESLEMSLHHPLFGVGLGMFPVAQNEVAAKRGERSFWQVTHNTYTQASSETGLPGLFFYVAALVCCFRTTSVLQKLALKISTADSKAIANLAYCLRLSLIGYAVTAFFSSNLYHSLFPTVAGLTVAFALAVQPLLTAAPTVPATRPILPAKGIIPLPSAEPHRSTDDLASPVSSPARRRPRQRV